MNRVKLALCHDHVLNDNPQSRQVQRPGKPIGRHPSLRYAAMMRDDPPPLARGKLRPFIYLILLAVCAIYCKDYLSTRFALGDWLGAGLVLLVFGLVLPISYLVHELGHALMGWLCGFIVTSFGIWPGRHSLTIPLGRTRMFIGTNLNRPGIALSFPARLYPGRWQWAGLLFGGILANVCVAVFGFLICGHLGRPGLIVLAFACVNAIGILNLLPFTVGKPPAQFSSDGLLILRVLRGVFLSERTLPGIGTLAALRSLSQNVGDRIFLAHLCSVAALEAVALRMKYYASSLITEAEQTIENRPPVSLTILALAKSEAGP
jgi:hypothetical protein